MEYTADFPRSGGLFEQASNSVAVIGQRVYIYP